MRTISVIDAKIDTNYTKCTTFIKSMLGFGPLFYGKDFHNSYIALEPRRIFLVFKRPFVKSTIQFVFSILEEDPRKINSTHTEEYSVFEMEIPSEYHDDFDKFIEGKYSKFSDNYKLELLDFHTDLLGDRSIDSIIFPTKYYRYSLGGLLGVTLDDDAEIFDIPDLEEEIFKPEMYLNNG